MMGWGRYFLLGDFGQQMDLQEQQEELQRMRDTMELQRTTMQKDPTHLINQLQKENDELKLYLAALVRILVSKGVMTSAELKQMIETVDSDDGTKDNRFTGNMTE